MTVRIVQQGQDGKKRTARKGQQKRQADQDRQNRTGQNGVGETRKGQKKKRETTVDRQKGQAELNRQK